MDEIRKMRLLAVGLMIMVGGLVIGSAAPLLADEGGAKDEPKAEAPAEPEKQAEKPESPKPKNIQEVLQELAMEGRQFRETGEWPRRFINYRVERGVSLPNEAVINALTRPLDRDPAVDGYIKWQLLGFQPDLSEQSGGRLGQIVRGFPKILPKPDPTPQQLQLFTAFRGLEQDPSEQQVARVRAEQVKYDALVDAVAKANEKTLEYRQLIINRFPNTNGFRVAGRMQDLIDRLDAREPGFKDLRKVLIADARLIKEDPKVTIPDRRRLKAQLDRLREMTAVNYYWRSQSDMVWVNGKLEMYYKHADETEAYILGRDYKE